jgi:hypothetical protein
MFILAAIVLFVLSANAIAVPAWLLIIASIIASIEAGFYVLAFLLSRGIIKTITKDDWNK